jgi:hypothetical protein
MSKLDKANEPTTRRGFLSVLNWAVGALGVQFLAGRAAHASKDLVGKSALDRIKTQQKGEFDLRSEDDFVDKLINKTGENPSLVAQNEYTRAYNRFSRAYNRFGRAYNRFAR